MIEFDRDYRMTIGGRAVDAATTFAVVNPANGKPFAAAPDCAPAQLDAAVDAARAAFPAWRDTPLAERQALVAKAGDVLIEHAADLGRVLLREQGRPAEMATGEIAHSGQWLHAVARLAPPVHVAEETERSLVETRYVPLGVVGAISPWNFPVALSVWKLGPALVAGNTVVLKPSPFTPLAVLKMGELLAEVFPPGVLNVVSGGDTLGPAMTAHPGFAKIAFTGSTDTGRKVMESAARHLKRLTLELGGNDAAIVLPDVDVEAAAQGLFHNAFFNSAQVCVATKRLYVHDEVYDALRDRLVAIAAAVTVGDGAEQGSQLGPIQNRRQYDRVRELVADAKASGLAVIEGSAVPDNGGYFVPVTIVDDPPETARVVQEEAFGPILPMLRFTDVEDAIARANDSPYGLAGSVWSKDVERATAIARRLETGSVSINQPLGLRPDTPFAGRKQSGIGVENGVEGLLEYMAPQTVYVTR